MESIGTDFPKQQARARTILGYYKEIGPAGGFGVMMIEQALQRADEAAMSGDPVAVLRSYQELRDIQE